MHQPTQLFYEDEVFKTGHMVDHPVEDIIERIGCQFYTKVCEHLNVFRDETDLIARSMSADDL